MSQFHWRLDNGNIDNSYSITGIMDPSDPPAPPILPRPRIESNPQENHYNQPQNLRTAPHNTVYQPEPSQWSYVNTPRSYNSPSLRPNSMNFPGTPKISSEYQPNPSQLSTPTIGINQNILYPIDRVPQRTSNSDPISIFNQSFGTWITPAQELNVERMLSQAKRDLSNPLTFTRCGTNCLFYGNLFIIKCCTDGTIIV